MSKLVSLDSIVDINDVKGLRKLYDEVETQVRSLTGLGLDPKSYGSMLTPVLFSKLPDEFKLVISRRFGKALWDIDKILEFYNLELEAREKVHFEKTNGSETENTFTGSALLTGYSRRNKNAKYNASKSNGNNRIDATFSSRRSDERYTTGPGDSYRNKFERTAPTNSCVFCSRNHYPKPCQIITKPEIRKSILAKGRRCFKCFKSAHIAARCRSNIKCFKCNGGHHTSICTFVSNDQFRNEVCGRNNEGYGRDDNTALVNVCKKNSVLLQTAWAQVASTDEKAVKWSRLLFDSGSQMSYISPKMKKELQLSTLGKREVVIKTFGNSEDTKNLEVVKFAVKGRDKNFNLYITALVTDICYPVEEQKIDLAKEKYSHLRNLPLADSNPNNGPLEIDILVGADHYWEFMSNKIVRGSSGPVAIESTLGFILSGDVNESSTHTNVVSTHLLKVESQIRSTGQDVKKVFGIEKSNISKENLEVYENFKKTTKYENGRYEVQLPFREAEDILGDNFYVAKGRLKSLYLNTFKNNEQLFREYDKIIQQQKDMGIIEVSSSIDENKDIGGVYYMPHKPVLRNDKSSTKVRMVFDASSSTKKGKNLSLNDCLFSGPSLTPPLFDVLLRFRAYPVVVVADIEKAFLQVNLAPEHRDYVRFLWFSGIDNVDDNFFENNELLEYRVCRVLFGLTPSPFLLTATLIGHIKKYEIVDPALVKKLLNSFHVDDLNSGGGNVKEALELYVKAKKYLAEGNFNLRKFKSNSVNLEKQVYEMYPEDKLFSEDNKVLGLIWDKFSDKIIFDMNEIRAKFVVNPTKRGMLQSIASVYDPLSLLSPITVKMKNLYQDVCISKLSWDQNLSAEFLAQWKNLVEQFEQIDRIVIPRQYCFSSGVIEDIQLHSFSDASKRNIAVAIYLRFRFASGNIVCTLVNSKSRVLCKNVKFTIPRAELLGAVLMMEQVVSVSEALRSVYSITKRYYWIDSAIVYAWILNNSKKYDNYTNKRLEKIRTVIEDIKELKLVPSKLNPADIGTRGMSPKELMDCKSFWFCGPGYLALSEDKWPNLQIGDKFNAYEINANEASIVEMKCVSTYVNAVEKSERNVVKIIDAKRFSSLNKLYRVTAYVIRFMKKLIARTSNKRHRYPRRVTFDVLNCDELLQAKLLWVYSVQSEYLKNDMKKIIYLRNQLDIFCDENGLWRCGGRMKYAEMKYDTKHPYLLPKESHFTVLAVINSHEEVKHNGVKETLSNLRSQFWITRSRNFIKKIIHGCVICRYVEGEAYNYPKVT